MPGGVARRRGGRRFGPASPALLHQQRGGDARDGREQLRGCDVVDPGAQLLAVEARGQPEPGDLDPGHLLAIERAVARAARRHGGRDGDHVPRPGRRQRRAQIDADAPAAAPADRIGAVRDRLSWRRGAPSGFVVLEREEVARRDLEELHAHRRDGLRRDDPLGNGEPRIQHLESLESVEVGLVFAALRAGGERGARAGDQRLAKNVVHVRVDPDVERASGRCRRVEDDIAPLRRVIGGLLAFDLHLARPVRLGIDPVAELDAHIAVGGAGRTGHAGPPHARAGDPPDLERRGDVEPRVRLAA